MTIVNSGLGAIFHMEILIRDLLFINYAVPPERIRHLIPGSFDLETRNDKHGDARAFLSLVAFTVAEIRSNSLTAPGVSFNQINCRTYVDSQGTPAVYFLDLSVSSRMISAAASFLHLPVSYIPIELTVSTPADGTTKRYSVESDRGRGLRANVAIDGDGRPDGFDPAVSAEFITERPLGFIKSGTGDMYRIKVDHARLNAVATSDASIRSPSLESMGILLPAESAHPHSVLYAQESLFDAEAPGKIRVS